MFGLKWSTKSIETHRIMLKVMFAVFSSNKCLMRINAYLIHTLGINCSEWMINSGPRINARCLVQGVVSAL